MPGSGFASLAGLSVLAVFGMFVPGGCVVQVFTDGGGFFGGSSPETIRIRVVNETTRDLDPGIYIASDTISDPNALFTAEHKFTRLGVGLVGVLGPGDSDTIEVSCDQARTIATDGGTFGGGDDGNDLSNPAGHGRQIILFQDQSVFCGDRVTFRYRRVGGEFTTVLEVRP